MPNLILCRHGQSEWNAKNLFTGWADVKLSEQGIEEAQTAGKKIYENKIEIDVAYTSLLTRALETTQYILAGSEQQWIPVNKSWRLNERHYGGLQGLNKDDAREKWGEEQVHQWRRSYDVQPPKESEEQREEYLNNRRYQHLDKRMMPYSESLKDTLARVVPIWTDRISQHLLDGETVLVSAHGNSIRALIKYLENLSEEEIVGYEIKTGAPLVYELTDDLEVKDKYYL
ncbi:2,3-diphosphoglycerate-dependent phosphoglycerate mutase [Staphylococcus saccharolyticus]|uniref:2,3-diphosphoglycerate-dependent phosphoglycerate mutase n=1 Tax=Staphylococcus saccharolyticus TaxID=33028 RepID=UPI00102DF652|nr:2,3-diphosphoglycerate-dependent phosphoglycerate mutase [Staphylococcus saccharolyticus]MBL7573688.1 2,3-diphosphoglycerate-dependent phosphoglycerate mutase [Staphylococcus saccharolyticus]MBL7584522.1 2,3-diphosphoglycerate-dependent phosphoglycerate mutase [Staphylococcus saccharolyticus]MBL7639384.1 2,3-diphosphoglycerate-dependent phosphoglycerate mutase [Staphylococcus saccharolyticus]QRJ68703.1 2,3-diphosphoglycerate-dependent phosphoglycerate mutase [Staphylococcus saccharolyticus]